MHSSPAQRSQLRMQSSTRRFSARSRPSPVPSSAQQLNTMALYQIHTNRELELMLRGTKPLAAFVGLYPPNPDVDDVPESAFEPHVSSGRFFKREYVFVDRDGHRLRRVLYSLPSEGWRIDAYILMWLTAERTGWNVGFERMEGSLLGYEEWQNDLHIARWLKSE